MSPNQFDRIQINVKNVLTNTFDFGIRVLLESTHNPDRVVSLSTEDGSGTIYRHNMEQVSFYWNIL